ncbi:MAG TPA: DUF4019 domain-containing protein [Candidatus Acidoferrales bacterium]|nr:DUF4019 domain-containing protein [Candidatus Acidoferrales bacterium]
MALISNGRIARGAALLLSACMALLAVCSCGSVTKDATVAKQAVASFHSQLDAGQYATLYEGADPKLHAMASETDFTKLLDAVHRKLGTVREANLANWKAGWYAGQGTTVSLTYNTTFSAGSGTEQFVWHIDNGRALLYGYHINSADLIEK